MQAINESVEHGKKAEAYAEQARQKDDFPDSEMAWIESNLAVAKAVTGLALAVLAHDGKVAAQQVAEADAPCKCGHKWGSHLKSGFCSICDCDGYGRAAQLASVGRSPRF